MKKVIITISIILIIMLSIAITLYFTGLAPVSNSTTSYEFTLNSGTNKLKVIDNLKEAGLIKSKYSGYIYVLLNHNLNLQAGRYSLNKSMGLKKILATLNAGKIIEEKNTFNLRFIEGKRLTDYAVTIASATNTDVESVLTTLNDHEYLQELIDKYWFLTSDILNSKIYYPLEGYLFPSTYELYNGSSVKDIITKMLDGTDQVLSKYKNLIEESSYTVHEILTLASIVELEGAGSNDRAGVAGVFYNRLKSGDSLGSDVTTYYAAHKDFSQDLTISELNNCNNGYNTRNGCNRGKLPVGPICSPSTDSIIATINPSKHDYYFFVSDINKKTYFTKTNREHDAKVAELKASGLWYQYK